MKEIIFRAWDRANKKMLPYVSGILWGEAIIPTNYVQAIFDYKIPNNYEYLFEGEMMKVSDIDLMQYTGLKDKKGKEIYEGDIITTNWGNFEKGKIGYYLAEFVIKDGNRIESLSKMKLYNWEFEIIGNVYENLELLEH